MDKIVEARNSINGKRARLTKIIVGSVKALLASGNTRRLIDLAESGEIPDVLLRFGMRRLMAQRLDQEFAIDPERAGQRHSKMIEELRASPIAIETDLANEQHYEVPTEFYLAALGSRLKYSSAYYPAGCSDLDDAEEAMLGIYLERAELQDGMNILELGCGWGSLTLWMAENLPKAKIVAVSNSKTQKAHILEQCKNRGLSGVSVITEDVNNLSLDEKFDRVISIEMFEHMRNYQTLLENIASWLRSDGKLFVHIFCHKTLLYPFEVQGEEDWMSKHFFSGGLMPSRDTLLHFQQHLQLEQRWMVNGQHYEKTCNAWLANSDDRRDQIIKRFATDMTPAESQIVFQRWRMFFMACAELFGYRNGSEWMVGHYLFNKSNE
jgi:cyclopropane-fatty-acyl-phospholipid synthase